MRRDLLRTLLATSIAISLVLAVALPVSAEPRAGELGHRTVEVIHGWIVSAVAWAPLWRDGQEIPSRFGSRDLPSHEPPTTVHAVGAEDGDPNSGGGESHPHVDPDG